MPSSRKKRIRALQGRTGWSYSECLRCIRTYTESQIDELVKERIAKHGLGQPRKRGEETHKNGEG